MNRAQAEDSLIAAFNARGLPAHATLARRVHSSLGDEGDMPELGAAFGWLKSAPLSRQLLHGKVVVLPNFWKCTRINSLRPMPYLKSWATQYKDAGFVVIGVHTPDF
jgi:hypothetical protein